MARLLLTRAGAAGGAAGGRCPGLGRASQHRLLASPAAPEPPAEADAAAAPQRPQSLWGRFVQWSYRSFGGSLYPAKAEICNCGIDVGVKLPRPELLHREGVETGSQAWRMNMYGAALYWHMGTRPTEKASETDPDMLRGKDVLEVACMRGGGARYLAEVAGPRRYVATDHVEEHIEQCRSSHPPVPGLEFDVADALQLAAKYPAGAFDYVLCVQAAAQFASMRQFMQGVHHVLRPGGCLLLFDNLTRQDLEAIMIATEELGMVIEVTADLSRSVHAVGLCTITRGISCLRFVIRKAEPQAEGQGEALQAE